MGPGVALFLKGGPSPHRAFWGKKKRFVAYGGFQKTCIPGAFFFFFPSLFPLLVVLPAPRGCVNKQGKCGGWGGRKKKVSSPWKIFFPASLKKKKKRSPPRGGALFPPLRRLNFFYWGGGTNLCLLLEGPRWGEMSFDEKRGFSPKPQKKKPIFFLFWIWFFWKSRGGGGGIFLFSRVFFCE